MTYNVTVLEMALASNRTPLQRTVLLHRYRVGLALFMPGNRNRDDHGRSARLTNLAIQSFTVNRACRQLAREKTLRREGLAGAGISSIHGVSGFIKRLIHAPPSTP